MLPAVITVERLVEDSSHQSGPTFVPPLLVFLFCFFSLFFFVHADCLTTHTQFQPAGKFSRSFFFISIFIILDVGFL